MDGRFLFEKVSPRVKDILSHPDIQMEEIAQSKTSSRSSMGSVDPRYLVTALKEFVSNGRDLMDGAYIKLYKGTSAE